MKTLSNKQLEEMEPKIVEELTKTKGKDAVKQVANKLKIDQDLVRHIYNTRKIGQKKIKVEPISSIVQISSPTTNNLTPSVNVAELLPNPELQSKVSGNLSEDTNNVEVKGGGKGKRLSDDIKIAVAMDLETGEYTYSQLCEKYNISYASVARIKKEIIGGGDDLRKQQHGKKRSGGKRTTSPKSMNKYQVRKSIEELQAEYVKKSEEEVAPNNEKEQNIATISDSLKTAFSTTFKIEEVKETAVKVGLCADRHEMNVDKFIFGTLNESEMFNYPLLYNKAMAFIADNCPDKILHLYCTGIQCALAAVIKACHDSKCTLSLFHYNASNSTYMRQDMWKYTDTFVDELTAAYADILRKGPVYTFNAQRINQEEFFTISINEINRESDGFANQVYVICSSIEDAFKLYADYVKYSTSDEGSKQKKAIFLTRCKVEKGKFLWDANICKSFNYK